MSIKHRGFTLFETLIVLGLVTLLFCLITPNYFQSRQLIIENQFWHSLRQQWRTAQINAQLHHRSTIISYQSATRQLVFDSYKSKEEISLPTTLSIETIETVVMHEDGYVKPQTIVFYSRAKHCHYLMKIQLAWGGYRVEKENK